MPDELVNMIIQEEFYFDSQNLQDSFNLALSQRALCMGHIGHHLHTRLGHNY